MKNKKKWTKPKLLVLVKAKAPAEKVLTTNGCFPGGQMSCGSS